MRIFSVSECVQSFSAYLKELGPVVVQGEVTGFRFAKDRQLVFFELKDDQSRMLCFALSHEMHNELEDGQEIQVVGVPQLFKASGGFHLRVQEVQLVGEGALQAAYKKLFEKLSLEGLFAEERRRPLPRFPQTIGLITSPDAAAYEDFIKIIQNRWNGVCVTFFPSGVQGPGSIGELVKAIDYANTHEQLDILVVTRGGGSIEDLQAFNSEEVVRALSSSRIPTVVGVGHERDTTLADFAADVRASTPSNAAERVVPEASAIQEEIENMVQESLNTIQAQIKEKHYRVSSCLSVFDRFMNNIQQAIVHREQNLQSGMVQIIENIHAKLSSTERLLKSYSPQRVLKRGYSISFVNGKVVTSATDVLVGKKMKTQFAKGEVDSTIISTS
ncbi:MAG: exodeoxyribonuclease VII large subunit [Candidatus Jacksonbacteria bacterium]|nr:exodeoxyribonuclease VII large subunit [Candidatus Jacksonbacteria bacterium]